VKYISHVIFTFHITCCICISYSICILYHCMYYMIVYPIHIPYTSCMIQVHIYNCIPNNCIYIFHITAASSPGPDPAARCIYTHMCIHACMHAYIHTYMHTRMHTNTQTTHTHTHTHTHITCHTFITYVHITHALQVYVRIFHMMVHMVHMKLYICYIT
jgi:hypothetical protein